MEPQNIYPGDFNTPVEIAKKAFPRMPIIIGTIVVVVAVGGIVWFSSNRNVTPDLGNPAKASLNKNLGSNLSTCQAQGGVSCKAGEGCEGTWLQALDTNICCQGNCVYVPLDNPGSVNKNSTNTANEIVPAGPIFCERTKPPFYRYFEWVFFDDVNSIIDNPNRKQIWWTKDTEFERKDYMVDYEILNGKKYYYNRILSLYDKKAGTSKSYMISVDQNMEDVCTSGQLQYYEGLTKQIVYQNEVSTTTVNIGGKTCYLLKNPRDIGGGYRTLDCINKDLCEFMIEGLGNTGEKIAAIALNNTEIPAGVFAVPDECVGK